MTNLQVGNLQAGQVGQVAREAETEPLSRFHPSVRDWFGRRFGAPSPPQSDGWPLIQDGKNVLIAAPTGTGKTLAAFMWAIDSLFESAEAAGETLFGTRVPAVLPDEARVVYVSPLKALANDIEKNLAGPLEELRALDPSLPEVRVQVRTGDSTRSDRLLMVRRPPHIVVTTPESLYLLLTSEGGRRVLSTVETVIVDEIHALVRDKRGAHLALSLERLESLTGGLQRIGLSATQRPVEEIGRFLVGVGRGCEIVDIGHARQLDLAVEVPESPLSAVCSHETWEEIYRRIADLVSSHRTTLIFVNTRRMAERVSARLEELLGEDAVRAHHGSLSKERRLDAERRLRAGALEALVATASLELGIDIGEVDLVIQIGSVRSIATLLQRIGRAGHSLYGVPKGRIFPLTLDELVEAAAALRAVEHGVLDTTPQPRGSFDILAQQIVAAVVEGPRLEDELYETFKQAWPYRNLSRGDFDKTVSLHTSGRYALVHRDGVNGRIMATKRARLAAIMSGGAIPDLGNYQVFQEPDETHVGTLDEDFAVESSTGDIFQLGNTSWLITRVESGVIRVVDAQGAPPTIPFWLGEAPSRSRELAGEVGDLREDWSEAVDVDNSGDGVAWLIRETGLSEEAASQLDEYFAATRSALGALPTRRRVIVERFFDESGGMQLVLHSSFGGRINRAWGLALRKRFCRSFGFELQAAADEDSILLSLGQQHSFPLREVFDYLKSVSVRGVLTQAILGAPVFPTRWRWNVTRSLLVERVRNGKKVPIQLQRMRSEDLMAKAFPQAIACFETLPPGDIPVPLDHPLVFQTVEDCLTDVMDVEGLVEVLENLERGEIETVAVDTVEPSPHARGILSAQPYTFLDDAPLEERRTQAVLTRHSLDHRTADALGALDPEAIERVRAEAWPEPESAEELHEALSWMGFLTVEEARPWQRWIDALAVERRVVREGDRWFATEASRDPVDIMRGRLSALGPIFSDDPVLLQLESEGSVMRARFEGGEGWCDRALLARIHRYTLEKLRAEIKPVSIDEFLDYLSDWQHVKTPVVGPEGVARVLDQLAGFEAPAAAWEKQILSARVEGYVPDWLDQLVLSGEFVWGRLWGSGTPAVRSTPLTFLRRSDLEMWLRLAGPIPPARLSGNAKRIVDLLSLRGATFPGEIMESCGLIPSHFEMALAELISRGLATGDSYSTVRLLLRPPSKRRRPLSSIGRSTIFRPMAEAEDAEASRGAVDQDVAEFVARVMLARTGVVFKRLIERERHPVSWRDLVRVYRRLEARGEVRGGRFVGGFPGEQFALPEAVDQLRKSRRASGGSSPSVVEVSAADPLNLGGVLTTEARVPRSSLRRVPVSVG